MLLYSKTITQTDLNLTCSSLNHLQQPVYEAITCTADLSYGL